MYCGKELFDEMKKNEIGNTFINYKEYPLTLVFNSSFEMVYCNDEFLQQFSCISGVFSLPENKELLCHKHFGNVIDCVNAENDCGVSSLCKYCCFRSLLEETLEKDDWITETVLFTKNSIDRPLNAKVETYLYATKSRTFTIDGSVYLGIRLSEVSE